MKRLIVVLGCALLIACEPWGTLEEEACRRSSQCDGGSAGGGAGGGGGGGTAGGAGGGTAGGTGGGTAGGTGGGTAGGTGGGTAGGTGGGTAGGTGGGTAGGAGGGAPTCLTPQAGGSGQILYRRTLVGDAVNVAVAHTGCLFQVVREDSSGNVNLRTIPNDFSANGSVETPVATGTPGFALAARDGVVAIANGTTLNFFRADGGPRTGSVTLNSGQPGAIGLSLRGTELHAMVHGTQGTNNYAWTVARVAPPTVVDGGISTCNGVRVTRAAVLSSEEQVFSVSRSDKSAACTIINTTEPSSAAVALRAFVSRTDAGVSLRGYTSAPNSPAAVVGASGTVAIFGYGALSGTDMKLTRHVVWDSGFGAGSTVVDLDVANVVELLVAPNGDFYVVGTTRGPGFADLGGPVRVINDGGGADPFVAKFTGSSVTWIQNFGGAADETATHAVLTNDQLVVVGTCGSDAGSAICAGADTHWIVSLKP